MRTSYVCCAVLRAVAQSFVVLLVLLPKVKSAIALYLLRRMDRGQNMTRWGSHTHGRQLGRPCCESRCKVKASCVEGDHGRLAAISCRLIHQTWLGDGWSSGCQSRGTKTKTDGAVWPVLPRWRRTKVSHVCRILLYNFPHSMYARKKVEESRAMAM